MVIEISKNFLKILKEKDEEEFNKVIKLIERNIEDGIELDLFDSNFIYFDNETYEYLEDYIISRSFERYGDIITFIRSYVKDVDKYKIIINEKSNSKFEIVYEYEFFKYLLTSCPIIIVENINDKKIYSKILDVFSEHKLKKEFQNGNGSQVVATLKDNFNNKKISIVIVDCDKKYKFEINDRSTPYILKDFIDGLIKENRNNELYLNYFIIGYKNIEGLIPYRYVIENLRDKTKCHFDEMYKCQKNKEWLKYFDFKKGIKKNLKSNKKFILESLDWWKTQFELEKEFIDFIEEKLVNENDILISGIPNWELFELKEKDFIEKSSKEQQIEYKRLTKNISPLLITNCYIV